MATKKAAASKKSVKKTSAVSKTAVAKKSTAKTEAVAAKSEGTRGSKKFFGRKYETNESILTIFKKKNIYGSLLAEIFGVMLITIFFLGWSMVEGFGLNITFQESLQVMFVIIAVTAGIYAFSGANLNPIITAGLMATRRISAIRGVLYIIAQVVGALLGMLAVAGFKLGGVSGVDEAVSMPVIAETPDGMFWFWSLMGLLSAVVIGFFFARALAYRKSVFTFASIVGGGMLLAMTLTFLLQTCFVAFPESYQLANNAFTFNNPAIALMYQIIPTGGENFYAILGELGLALSTYVVFPVVGAIIGFYLSDSMTLLTAGKIEE